MDWPSSFSFLTIMNKTCTQTSLGLLIRVSATSAGGGIRISKVGPGNPGSACPARVSRSR